MYVVVQFYPWFKCFLSLVFGYGNMIISLKQKWNKFKARINLNHDTYPDPIKRGKLHCFPLMGV